MAPVAIRNNPELSGAQFREEKKTCQRLKIV